VRLRASFGGAPLFLRTDWAVQAYVVLRLGERRSRKLTRMFAWRSNFFEHEQSVWRVGWRREGPARVSLSREKLD